MPCIHVITDRERLKRVFSTFATPELSVRISGGLDAGLPELQHEVPEALFIQNHLNGLTAEILVRHVQNYASASTKIVLLREGSESCRGISLAVGTDVDDEDLLETIRDAIDRFAFGKRPAASRRKAASADEFPDEEEKATDSGTDSADHQEPAVPPPPFAEKLDGFIREMTTDSPNAPATSRPPRAEVKWKKDRSLAGIAGVTVGGIVVVALAMTLYPHENRKAPAHSQKSPAPSRIAATPPAPLAEKKPAPAAPVKPQAVATAVPLAATARTAPATATPATKIAPASQPVAPATQVLPKKPAVTPVPKQAPAPAATAPATSIPPAKSAQPTGKATPVPLAKPAPQAVAQARTALPAFIPKAARDPKYAGKPGWERYVGKNTEFRVFRPAGTVKAVQAIDRRGVGIPDDFLAYALNDLVGSPKFVVDGKEKKGDYTVTRATTAGGSRLVLYRKGDKKPLTAFVVYFDEPGKK